MNQMIVARLRDTHTKARVAELLRDDLPREAEAEIGLHKDSQLAAALAETSHLVAVPSAPDLAGSSADNV